MNMLKGRYVPVVLTSFLLLSTVADYVSWLVFAPPFCSLVAVVGIDTVLI